MDGVRRCMSKPSVLDVVTHRDFGWVRYGCVSTYRDESQVEILKRLGLVFEGYPLRELRSVEARQLLVEVFARPLAYTSSGPVVSLERARDLAETCLGTLFPASARYYTNVAADSPSDNPLGGLIAVSEGHTFGVGVVAVSDSAAACVWVEEED
jgi:hypothetical protein